MIRSALMALVLTGCAGSKEPTELQRHLQYRARLESYAPEYREYLRASEERENARRACKLLNP